MTLNNTTPLLARIINIEKQMFQRNTRESFSASTNINKIDNGNILFKVPTNRSAISRLTKGDTNHCIDKSTVAQFTDSPEIGNYDAHGFLRSVTNKFINIEAKASFVECINTIHHYQKAAGKHFYGALLRSVDNPDIIMNPFHVLTALSVMENEEYLNRHKFNILIYIHSNRNQSDEQYKTAWASEELINDNINALMQVYTSKAVTKINVKEVTPVNTDSLHDFRVRVHYTELRHKDENPNNVYHIVTHQLITKGIIAPYYGTSLIDWDRQRARECYGIHISPMHSCNIGGGYHAYIREERHNSGSNSVCTGSLDNYTYEGLRTLTHSNLSSAFTKYNLVPGFLAYVDAMIEKSIALYTAAGILESLKPKTVPEKYNVAQMNCKTIQEFIKETVGDHDGPKQYGLVELKKMFTEIQDYLKEQTEATVEDSEHCAISEEGCSA